MGYIKRRSKKKFEMKRRISDITLSVLFLATAITSCSRGLPNEFPAPDFSVEDIFTGEGIHLADLKGKPVLIYFFASW